MFPNMVSVQPKLREMLYRKHKPTSPWLWMEKTLLLIVDFIIAFDMVYYEILFRKLSIVRLEAKIEGVLVK